MSVDSLDIVNPLDPEGTERRRFFRIDDQMTLFCREIAPEEVPESNDLHQEITDVFSLTAALDCLTQEASSLLRKIERKYSNIADYLKIFDKKLDLVARAMLIRDERLAEQPTNSVNISASGMAFDWENPIEKGTTVELKMVLIPSLIAVVTYGNVVYCKQIKSGSEQPQYHIAVDFLADREQDREVLIRHVVKRQMQQIRQQNDSENEHVQIQED